MTWVYVPSNCAPDTEDLASASSWQFQVLAQSAWCIGSELWETELTLWSQRWRFRLFGIVFTEASK